MSPYRNAAIVKQEPSQVKLPNEWDLPISEEDCFECKKIRFDNLKLFYDKDIDLYYCKQCKRWNFFVKELDHSFRCDLLTYMYFSSDIKYLINLRNNKIKQTIRGKKGLLCPHRPPHAPSQGVRGFC